MRNTKTKAPSKKTRSKRSGLRRTQRFSTSQLLVFIVLFAVIGGYVIYSSFAAPSAKTSGTMYWSQTFSQMLEQMDTPEPYGAHALNTTGCVWNDGDQLVNAGIGSLTGSASNTMCLVADYANSEGFYPKTIMYKVYSPTDTLAVSLSNDAGSSWQSPAAIKSGKGYLYMQCINDPVSIKAGLAYGDTTGLLNTWPLIPNTNGGYGKIVHYTLNLTSLRATTNKISAYLEVGINGLSIAEHPYLQGNPDIPCPPRNQVSL